MTQDEANRETVKILDQLDDFERCCRMERRADLEAETARMTPEALDKPWPPADWKP